MTRLPAGRRDRVRYARGPSSRLAKERHLKFRTPRPPRELAPRVLTPWAWYHGDDLDYAESASVSSWPDRVGSASALAASGTLPTFTSSAIGGRPGTVGGDTLWTDFPSPITTAAPKPFDGLTLALVAEKGSTSALWHTMEGDGRTAELSWSNGFVWADAYGGYLEANLGAGPGLLVLRASPSGLDVHFNGSKLSTSWYDAPYLSEQTGYRHTLRPRASNRIGELAVFDWSLNDDDMAEWWAYAQDRYGL